MEQKPLEIYKQVLSIMKNKMKSSLYIGDDITNMQKLFFYLKKSPLINEKMKYIIEIMKKMNFEGEDVIIEEKYEIFYFKFFNLAKNIFEDKKNSKEISIIINIEDLNSFSEEEKKLIFLYLQYSIMVDNSLQIFFSFLNNENLRFQLESVFTCLDFDYINNFEQLLHCYELEILNKEIKKTKNKEEVVLIGFEELRQKYIKIKDN